MQKPKLLILQGEISAYNVPTYNVIADYFELTVGYYSNDKSVIPCMFSKKKFTSNKLGPFVLIKGLRKFAREFDVVSILPDLHLLNYCLLPFGRRNYKVVNWSIGFRASYKRPYLPERRHSIVDSIMQIILSGCDASIFYMEKAKEFWSKTSLDMEKVFVAPNTTDISKIEFLPEFKKDFLFVGTLYKEKGLSTLLNSFKKALERTNTDIKLNIVGEGAERKELEKFVEENNLCSNVYFKGAIYDENELAYFFQSALICISPSQAGLSVPKSMGYGVPFITSKNAITGGEIYHITSGINGIMYDDDSDLIEIMVDAINNPQKYINMGVNAMQYYSNHATIAHMAQGAIDAFEFALYGKK